MRHAAHRRRSAPVRLLLALVLVSAGAVATAGPASAHAVVVSSTPGDGERLAAPPEAVTIQFSEAVKADLGGLQVVDADGNRVDTGADTVAGDSLTVPLPSGLADGTYVASYRVVSADGHPVKGAIVFAVGNATTSGIDVASLSDGSADDPVFDAVGGVSRFVAYAGALTAAGLAFFLFFVHDGGPEARPLAQVVRATALLGAAGALGTLAAQAALATGRGWSAVFDPEVVHAVLTQSLDWATVVLLVGLAGVLLSLETRGRGARQALAFYGGIATTLSFVLWGHSTEGADRGVKILANAVHVTAAAAWLGGLVGLAVVLWRRTRHLEGHEPTATGSPDDGSRPSGGDTTHADLARSRSSASVTTVTAPGPVASGESAPEVEELRATATIVSRFSALALVTVLALWAAGVVLAWIEVGSREALTTTDYGRLVLIKVGIVLAVAIVAAYNRFRLVPDLLDEVDLAADVADVAEPAVGATTGATGPGSEVTTGSEVTAEATRLASSGLRRLARTVVVEGLAVLLVLGVTSVLVNTPPGTSAVAEVGVVDQTMPITTSTPGSTLNLVVAPATAGSNSVHLSYYDADGRPLTVSGPVRLELALPEADIGPITRETEVAGSGHVVADGIDLSPAGTWQITVVTRLSEFDQQRTTFSVKVR